MNLKQIKLNKIKNLPRILAENAFLTFLFFIFLALIISGIIFYKYSILVEEIKPEVLEKPLLFNEKYFQEILQVWQEKEKRFQKNDLKIYPDPFRVD